VDIISSLKKDGFINNTGQLIKPSKKWEDERLSKFKMYEKKLKELTSFLPEDMDLIYRLYVIESGIKNDWKCPVNGCNNPRERTTRSAGYFKLLCNKKDDEHIECYKRLHRLAREKACLTRTGYRTNFENPDKQLQVKQTVREKYGVDNISKLEYIKDKKEKTRETTNQKLLESGLGSNVMQKKLANVKDINKQFIIDNFIDDDNHLDIKKFMEYYSCSADFAYTTIRKFSIDITYKKSCFNPDVPAVLYYLYDPQEDLYKIGITNKTVEERFGKEFCSNRAIAILEQTHFDNGLDAYLAEQEILEAFAPYRCENPSWPETKGGRTEFFKEDILHKHKDNNETT